MLCYHLLHWVSIASPVVPVFLKEAPLFLRASLTAVHCSLGSLSDRRCFDLGFWPSNPSHVQHALARERWSLLLETSKHTQLACIELTAQLLQCDSSSDSWNESCSVVTLRSVDLVSCICDRSLHCDTATKAPTHIHIFRVGGSELFGVTDAFKHHLLYTAGANKGAIHGCALAGTARHYSWR